MFTIYKNYVIYIYITFICYVIIVIIKVEEKSSPTDVIIVNLQSISYSRRIKEGKEREEGGQDNGKEEEKEDASE